MVLLSIKKMINIYIFSEGIQFQLEKKKGFAIFGEFNFDNEEVLQEVASVDP